MKSEIDAAKALSNIVSYSDNEATAYPWWAIVSVGSFGRLVTHAGPWFSRESATAFLNAKRYNYPKSAHVYCFSGHESSDYRQLIDAARAATSAPANT